MFEILSGWKLSNRCKRSVKYIKCRIDIILKKKQVIVRYLKKDVADLLAGGHDNNAFGRIDALIVEINHASCYDMIEQYCGCLLEHLSTMCKERECPKEVMGAIATLIFAAARFSDLPELTDLRSVFTKRYGTRMESCIDKEFVEKIQKKSFSKATKLQLMEDIAQAFSVNWNSNMFENKISNQSAPSNHGNPITNKHATKDNEKQFSMGALQKLEIKPKTQIHSQSTPTNANIHAHDTAEKIAKTTADKLEITKPDRLDKIPDVKTKNNHNDNYRNDSIQDGNKNSKSQMVHEDLRDFKAINMIPPPYTKLTEGSNGNINLLVDSKTSEDVKELDHNNQDRKSQFHKPVKASSRRTFNSQPPYRKSDLNKTSNDTNNMNPTTYEKPTGTQVDMSKDDSNLSSQIQTKQGRETSKTTNDIRGEVRRTAAAKDGGGHDREEEIMDKLLIHYSKKDSMHEPRKTRTRRREAPKDPIADAVHLELNNPSENGVKSRVQVASKHTGKVLLRQTENEKPLAWIAAQH